MNQLYRPIDTTITSKAPHSTTSQSVISPIAENHVHDISDNDIVTSVNDIINKAISSINRSLPATPMAGINNTPRVLTTRNSSLNAKFKFLESKLYGEIITIKSYLTDELRTLKNETTISKEQVCDINTEETTTLKNKIKLLELENKLLKDNITNKQKFFDTLLQHYSKLSQNFDISSIISAANEARKQPHGKQYYKKNDTGLNNPQKQENKSSEKSNEKNLSNKEKNRSSEKDSLPTDKSNKNTYILGDSMMKHVEVWKSKKSIDQNYNVYVRSFSGANVKYIKDYVKPCIREKYPDYVIFHVRTNALNSELPPERIAKSIIDVAKNTQADSRIVSIFGNVPGNDKFNIGRSQQGTFQNV